MDDARKKAIHESLLKDGVSKLTITVKGDSMEPVLLSGDEVIFSRGLYLPGHILAFLQEDRVIIHRMIGWWFSDGSFKFVAKGDNLPRPDRLVEGTKIIGKMVHYKRAGAELKENFFLRTYRCLRSIKEYVTARI